MLSFDPEMEAVTIDTDGARTVQLFFCTQRISLSERFPVHFISLKGATLFGPTLQIRDCLYRGESWSLYLISIAFIDIF